MKQISKLLMMLITSLSIFSSNTQVVEPVDKNKIANGGYDFVAYFTDNSALKGNTQNTVEYKGAKYQFSSAEHLSLFKNNPEKYLPVCDGYCAWGVAEKGKKVPVNPETYKIIDGKLYLFFNGDFNGSPFNTLDEWNKNQGQLLTQLPVKWAKLKNKN
jgi:YHS domain-containing protein